MRNFLTFRTMVTPTLIQAGFWIGFVLCIASSVYTYMNVKDIKRSLEVLILGPIFLRITCELLILHFRINDNLKEINQQLKAD